ncbi:MAG: ribbon-helix-helix protein, CopG family [Micropruina sp.]|nr:ribbon-helix-helix protein, CopG family [Micropruina sp.]
MQRTNIYLEERQTRALDRRAADEGISRAELIRRLLDRAIEGQDEDLAADLAAIDESFGAVPDLRVDPRTVDERDAHLDRLWNAP